MGQCYGKTTPATEAEPDVVITETATANDQPPTPVWRFGAKNASPSPWPSPYPRGGASAAASPLPAGVSPSPARSSTPGRFFKRRFAPPSPAKHIKASLAKRLGTRRPKDGPIPEEGGEEAEQRLDKAFGYSKNIGAKYELGAEVGRGHFGHTCSAKGKKGDLKDQSFAVKIISKAKVPNALAFFFFFFISLIIYYVFWILV